MQFQSFQRDRFHVHVYNTTQFKTRHMSMKLAFPITTQSATRTAMLPYLWMEGTTSHPNAEALQRYADTLYGTALRTALSKRGDRQVLEAAIAVPDESGLDAAATGLFQRATDLLFDVVMRPATEQGVFPTRHVNRERALHQHRIESIFDDKIAYAADRCLTEACAGEAAGLPRLGFLAEVSTLSTTDLWQAYQDLLGTADVHVYVVGHVGAEPEVANTLLERLANGFPQKLARNEVMGSVVPLQTANRSEPRYVGEQQQITQAKLDLAYRTGLSVASQDYPAMLVMNGIFGGTMQSKLFRNVREKASLAYYCSSRFDNLTGIVFVQMGIELDNYDRALTIVREQLDDVCAGNITADELAFTIAAIRNQYTQLADFPMSVADVHFNTVLGGTARNLEELLAAVTQVGPEDVVRVAQFLRLDTVYLLSSKEANRHA